MRLVVFTRHSSIDTTPWWPVLLATPGVTAVLVCRKTESQRLGDVLRRQWRNLRKHGPVWIPYRLWVGVWTLARRPFARPLPPRATAGPGVGVERFEAESFTAEAILVRVRDFGADLGVSLGAPMLRPQLFRLPRLGTINLHSGKVPEFRGAPPAFWELYTGAADIGATAHWMDEGLDTGAIITAATAPIYPADSLARVQARASELALEILGAALHRIGTGEVGGTPQQPGGRTYRFPTLRQRAWLALRLAWRRAGLRLSRPVYPVKVVAALGALAVFRPLRDAVRTARRRHPVRVFTFHRVTELCRDGMTVGPDVFRRQVAYLRRHHDIVALDRAVELLQSGARLSRPVAAITFDDGYRSVVRQARAVLEETGAPGCCFVCTDLVGTDRRLPHDRGSPVERFLEVMDWAELAALRLEGWVVGGHTASHPRLSACDEVTLRGELERPIRELRQRLELDAVPMAYPFGGPDDITPAAARMVRDCGYTACFSDFGGENFAAPDPYDLFRIDLGGDHETLAWKLAAHGIELRRFRLRRAARDNGGA